MTEIRITTIGTFSIVRRKESGTWFYYVTVHGEQMNDEPFYVYHEALDYMMDMYAEAVDDAQSVLDEQNSNYYAGLGVRS